MYFFQESDKKIFFLQSWEVLLLFMFIFAWRDLLLEERDDSDASEDDDDNEDEDKATKRIIKQVSVHDALHTYRPNKCLNIVWTVVIL